MNSNAEKFLMASLLLLVGLFAVAGGQWLGGIMMLLSAAWITTGLTTPG